MHVAFVFHSYPPHPAPEPAIEADTTTRQWARALQSQGIKLTVVHRFFMEFEIEFEGVDYLFLKDNQPGMPRPWNTTRKFNKDLVQVMKDRKVDIIHAHNPFNAGGLYALSTYLKEYPIIVQDHVGVQKIRRNPWWLRLGLSKVQKVIFSAQGQEADWVKKKVLDPEKIHFVMENTSPFKMQPRPGARRVSGMNGAPVFLWVGNLNTNKSPFTVLRAFEQVLIRNAEARLYMIYKSKDLEQEILAWLKERPGLSQAIQLLGEIDHTQLEYYYNSADYFLAASHKEGSGYAAIEALSCGVVPILSDIPSFNSLTGNGQVGALFQVGNHDSLAKVMIETLKKPLLKEKTRTEAYYQDRFSTEALGKNMKQIYESLLNEADLSVNSVSG